MALINNMGEWRVRTSIVVALTLLVLGLSQVGADSHMEKTDQTQCKIEDIRWTYRDSAERLRLEGTATCSSGYIVIRAYAKKQAETVYLGNMETFIRGYAFSSSIRNVPRDARLPDNQVHHRRGILR